jgi:hypothetical protein
LWNQLHEHFTDPELVELGFFVGLTLGQQRWIKTLGIGHGEVLPGTEVGLAGGVLSGGEASPGSRRAGDLGTSAARP